MDSKELAGVVSSVRTVDFVELPVRTANWYADLQLMPPEKITWHGTDIAQRKIKVVLSVGIASDGKETVHNDHYRNAKVLGRNIDWDYGCGRCYIPKNDKEERAAAAVGTATVWYASREYAADTLSDAVAAAVAEWESIDGDAYNHYTKRMAAVAAEEAAYQSRLQS